MEPREDNLLQDCSNIMSDPTMLGLPLWLFYLLAIGCAGLLIYLFW